MAAFLTAASAYLQRSQILANYAVASPTNSPSIGSSSAAADVAPCQIGLWHVQRATHTSSGKHVSIWTFDRATGGGGSSTGSSGTKARQRLDKAAEVAKREASLLTRLRHPCVLEVVEPLEETRTSLLFATEPITAALRDAIAASAPGSARPRRGGKSVASALELDEVEIQKGLLQVGKGLQFLHEQAKLVHLNLTEDAVVINAKGDWKLAGFGLSTYLSQPDGSPARWSFPEQDARMAPGAQLNLDYLAPEYAVDEQPPSPAADMYSLGCIVYAIHSHAGPPFRNHGELHSLRTNVDNIGVLRTQWSRLPDEVQDVLAQLITRYPSSRLTAATFQSSRYFNSVLVATLRFLDRDNFNGKGREEQASFMKGLTRILPQFSDKVVKRKILPSLLEETRKHMLLPFLLPNIFLIGEKMDTDEFRESLLPQLKPLFAIREPPQSMLTMLDHITLFESKCTPVVFREEVMPLVYAALESDLQPVLEKALEIVPKLAATLDYTTVKTILFPRVAAVFSKTTFLSVKVNTLICFHAMVGTLDKYTLTEKLVPLLARIKTKEPSVMVATLAVHDEIGKKIDIDAIATLILPQLWAMSIGPLLNADQFARFMSTIRKLGARVETEHSRHLAELKRLESSSSAAQRGSNGINGGTGLTANGEVDFETLVKGAAASTTQQIAADPFGDSLDDGAGFNSFFPSSATTSRVQSPAPPTLTSNTPMSPLSPQQVDSRRPSFSPSPAPSPGPGVPRSALGARPIPSTSHRASALPPEVRSFGAPLASSMAAPPISNGPAKPNYNISLAPAANFGSSLGSTTTATLAPSAPIQPQPQSQQQQQPAWNVVKPLAFAGGGGVMQPSKPAGSRAPSTNFADLDPYS